MLKNIKYHISQSSPMEIVSGWKCFQVQCGKYQVALIYTGGWKSPGNLFS
jgi:hypothetical protein